MHARVTELQMRPDRVEHAHAFIRTEISPTYRRMRGFRGAVWLADASRQFVLAVTLWATWEALERSPPVRSGRVERTMRYLSEPPRIEPYQVRAEDRVVGAWDAGMHHARVHLARFQPGQLEEGLRLMRDRLIIPARIQQHYLGRLLLANAGLDKAIAISFWETAEAAGGTGDPDETSPGALRLTELLVAPIHVARYEITAQG